MLPSFPSEAEARHEEGFLNSADHLRLYWQRFTPERALATVVVLHGGGDHSGRYPGITAALVRAGFQVALLDFRGHGQSDGRRWHVDAFSDYLHDLDAFVAKLSQDGVARDRLFIVGHSQGGLIAALWADIARPAPLGPRPLVAVLQAGARSRPPRRCSPGSSSAGWCRGCRSPPGLQMSQLTSDPELQRWTDRDPLYGRDHDAALVRGVEPRAARGAAPRAGAERAAARPRRRRRRRSRTSPRRARSWTAASATGQAHRRVRRVPTRDLQRGPPRAADRRGGRMADRSTRAETRDADVDGPLDRPLSCPSSLFHSRWRSG